MAGETEIVLYNPDKSVNIEVRLEDETVWLTQAQMALLFDTTPQNVTMHIRGIYGDEELLENSTCKDFLQVRQEGQRMVTRKQKIYNLDVIISVGYRVKSKRGVEFRQWANKVLKDFLLRGYAILDNSEMYLFGASLKDLGKKMFAFTKLDNSSIALVMSRIKDV